MVSFEFSLLNIFKEETRNRRITKWLVVAIVLLLASGTDAFITQVHNYKHSTGQCGASVIPQESCLLSSADDTVGVTNPLLPSDRFHMDMRRVLESRQTNIETERRSRPRLLETDVDGAGRVYAMLQHMIKIQVATEESFQIVMRAFLQRRRIRWKSEDSSVICAADMLERLLGMMDGKPSLETYNMVLEAYATCSTPRGDRNYAERAQKLLDEMPEHNLESQVHVLHAWAWQQANRKPGNCAQQAQDMLPAIEKSTNDRSILLQCYDWVLEAWSKSEGSVHKADAIFRKMKDLQDHKLPNSQSYSNAILAWSKSKEPDSAEKATSLLMELVKSYESGSLAEPELIAFNCVITAWSRKGHPEMAEKILWFMNDVRKKCKDLKPDALTYNSVLHSMVNQRRPLDKVLSVVQHMEDGGEEQPSIRPNMFTYNTLIKAWVQSNRPDIAQNAEQILMKMEEIHRRGRDRSFQLTNRSFNIVINAYAKSQDHFAARKAFNLLERMEGNVEPDIISYTSVIECFSKSSDPNASQTALDLLQRAFGRAKDDPDVMPNLRTFTMVILTLAKCPAPGNASKARALLTQLVELYESTKKEDLRPNEYPYNYVLNCAANAVDEKIEAFRIATQTYQEMRKSQYVKPDSFTYAFWIKSCNNLLPAESELQVKAISLAFEHCKRDGLVSNEVLHRLQQGSHPSLVEELLKSSLPKHRGTSSAIPDRRERYVLEDLPAAWSRNARRK